MAVVRQVLLCGMVRMVNRQVALLVLLLVVLLLRLVVLVVVVSSHSCIVC